MSEDIIAKSEAILKANAVPDRSSYFQLKNFVIGKESTLDGQAWTCIRNIQERQESLQALELEIENGLDNVELLDIRLEKLGRLVTDDELERREVEIEKRKMARERKALVVNIDKLRDKIKYILEELQYFVMTFEALKHVKGAIKSFDDVEAQVEYWNAKLTEELNLNLILKRPVSTEFAKTVLALEDRVPIKKSFLQILEKMQRQTLSEKEAAKLESKEKNG